MTLVLNKKQKEREALPRPAPKSAATTSSNLDGGPLPPDSLKTTGGKDTTTKAERPGRRPETNTSVKASLTHRHTK